MTFGERLQHFMAEQHLTQAELARLMDVPQQSISRWVNAETPPRPATVKKLASALEVSSEDLLFDKSPAPSAASLRVIAIPRIDDRNSPPFIVPATYLGMDGLREGDLAYALVLGDAMSPHLQDGDIAILRLETHRADIRDGAIYYFRARGESIFRRLSRKGNGEIELRSDNPDYPTPTLFEDEIFLSGRVVYVFGRR